MSYLMYDRALLAFGFSPGPPEMLLLLVIALLLYGGKLPEMARTWGKTLAEFRRSLSGIQREFNDAMYTSTEQLTYEPENDPYTSESTDETKGYEEALQNDPPQDNLDQDDSSTNTSPEDPPSTDSEADEELSSEKPSLTDSD